MKKILWLVLNTVGCLVLWYVSVCGLTWIAWNRNAVQTGQFAMANVMIAAAWLSCWAWIGITILIFTGKSHETPS